ncbi:hypothetical protein PO909_016463 [Leuciscus waleckii]
MASVEELLVNSLEDLGKGDLKKFQWHLKKDHECILKSVMEKTDVLKTVDKMVDCFGPEETVKITVKILRKMNQNNLAEQLESKHKTVSLCDIKQRPERNNSDTHTTGDQIHPKRDEPCLTTDADKARYFKNYRSDLIQRVTNAKIIADKLRDQELIHDEQYSEITQSLTSQESMRKICEIIHKHGDTAEAEFISILQEEKLYHFRSLV